MKKIIDQDGRLFGRMSIIDLVAILLVILLGIGVYMKQTKVDYSDILDFSGDKFTVTYQLSVKGFTNDFLPELQVGDELFDRDQATNGSIGEIISIEVTPALSTVYLPDGSVAQATQELYSDLIITVEAEATIEKGSYYFNDVYVLGINASRNFYTPYVSFTAAVVSIG